MNANSKKVISIVASAAILAIMFYGSYLPLRKGRAYVLATAKLGNVKSIEEFTQTLSVPLDMASPIGQEELVRNSASSILSVVQSSGDNAEITAALTKFMESYYAPIIIRGKGMSFGQDLYLVGLINETAALKTRQSPYILSAERYFAQGRELGPDRPQFLYGLFDIARIKGDIATARSLGEELLSHWPTDERVQTALAELGSLKTPSSTQK